MTTYIYGLLCPSSGDIRYIGKSVNPNHRFKRHLWAAANRKYDHHTARWIRSLLAQGLSPVLSVLETVDDDADWREAERSWISAALTSEWPLTNSTPGGEGLFFLRPEDEEKYRENHRKAMEFYRETEAGKQQLKRFLDASRAPDALERRRSARTIATQRPEFREKMRAVAAEIGARPEVKAVKSAKSIAMWQDPESRQKIVAALRSDDCKSKQSEARKSAWADPLVGAKLREIHTSDEVRRKKSEAALRRATPEYRAMMAEKTRASWLKRKQ